MAELIKAKESFRFYTRLTLSELTGLKANNLEQLLALVREVPGSCIYQHTHRFLQLHQYLSPEPPNDFAYWVGNVLGEHALSEWLASIDTMEYLTIRSLREKIIEVIDAYLKENETAKLKFARAGEEFYFMKSTSFVLPTNYVVDDLAGFIEVLKKITVDSIYFHIFEARLRLEKGTNDFSYWIDSSIGDKELAKKIAGLDPYTRTLNDLRKTIIKTIEKIILP